MGSASSWMFSGFLRPYICQIKGGQNSPVNAAGVWHFSSAFGLNLSKQKPFSCDIRMAQVHGVKVDVVEFLWFHGIGGVENDGFGGGSGVVLERYGWLKRYIHPQVFDERVFYFICLLEWEHGFALMKCKYIDCHAYVILFRFLFPKSDFICVIAIWFNCLRRRFGGTSCLIRTAFMLSKLESTTRCSIVA